MRTDVCSFDDRRWCNTHHEYRHGEFDLCFAMKPPQPLFVVGEFPVTWATTTGRPWDTKCITINMTTRYLGDVADVARIEAERHIEAALALFDYVQSVALDHTTPDGAVARDFLRATQVPILL